MNFGDFVQGLSHITPEKRTIDYRPRMGRRSNENDQQKPYEPKPYDVFFTPRMGKRSDILTNYTPSFGRSIFSGDLHFSYPKYTLN